MAAGSLTGDTPLTVAAARAVRTAASIGEDPCRTGRGPGARRPPARPRAGPPRACAPPSRSGGRAGAGSAPAADMPRPRRPGGPRGARLGPVPGPTPDWRRLPAGLAAAGPTAARCRAPARRSGSSRCPARPSAWCTWTCRRSPPGLAVGSLVAGIGVDLVSLLVLCFGVAGARGGGAPGRPARSPCSARWPAGRRRRRRAARPGGRSAGRRRRRRCGSPAGAWRRPGSAAAGGAGAQPAGLGWPCCALA